MQVIFTLTSEATVKIDFILEFRIDSIDLEYFWP